MGPNTSPTLLQRLATSDPVSGREAWMQFVGLYTPLLLAWARDQRLQDADATDLVQEIFVRLATKLPAYRRVEGHTFRSWLFTLVRNYYRDFRAARRNRALPGPDGLSAVEGPEPPDVVAEMDEREYRLRLTRRAMDVIRHEFRDQTWRAFELSVVRGLPVAAVASALDVTADAVHSACRRVLARLREELDGFLA